jgi:hypothetical protein
MNSPLLRKPTLPNEPPPDRYASLGLRDNPFPYQPTLVPDSDDPRVNGTIYCKELHVDKADDFNAMLIPTRDRRQALPVAFLMDSASRKGRGIGKSAFLKHQQREIMTDLGDAASGGAAVLFATYIVPTPHPSCRKFWEFCRLIFESMIHQNVLALALWRLRALCGKIPENVLAEAGTLDNFEDTIGNAGWLRSKGVDTWGLDEAVKSRLLSAGVPNDFAFEVAYHGSSSDDLKTAWMKPQKDSFWRREGGSLVFDWLVRTFRAAEFSRGLLLVDELEKIVMHQNLLERRAFVESLRYYLIDGSCQNARERFYGLLLTIHPLVQELLLAHWQAAGLDRLAPLNEPDAQQCTLYFPPLDKQKAVPLVKVYLDHFRRPEVDTEGIAPFTEDAVVEALLKSSGVPGRTLNLLHRVVERAAERSLRQIDKHLVDEVTAAAEPAIESEKEELPVLPRPQVNMQD